jgi:hypothetical protein
VGKKAKENDENEVCLYRNPVVEAIPFLRADSNGARGAGIGMAVDKLAKDDAA